MLLPIVMLAGVASAFPQFGGRSSHSPPTGPFPSASIPSNPALPTEASTVPWAPAGPGDSRSPCPALNTLANHYFLPHDGKGITTEMIIEAFAAGQNFAADTVTEAAAGALAICSAETGTNCTSFDLSMLDKPHAIEHDNSLSRLDYNFGTENNHNFTFEVWGQVLGVWRGAEIIDFALGKAAVVERVTVANKTDLPGWYVNAAAASYHETAFYISLFGDPVLGNAPQSLIDFWFQLEKNPYELGWSPTQRATVTAASLDAMVALIEAA